MVGDGCAAVRVCDEKARLCALSTEDDSNSTPLVNGNEVEDGAVECDTVKGERVEGDITMLEDCAVVEYGKHDK